MKINFEELAQYLLREINSLIIEWLPGGKLEGREYCCGSLKGEPGKSLKVNLDTGKWADFATDDKGGDLISLYAKMHGLKNSGAAAALYKRYNSGPLKVLPVQDQEKPLELLRPPKGTSLPNFKNKKLGAPTHKWTYKTEDGDVAFFVCRYNSGDKKEFRPFSWSNHNKWVNKIWSENRPLYGAELLKNSNKPVMVVEGEKACDAARKFCGHVYDVVTFSNGSNAWQKTNFNPLHGKSVLLWPDADKPGVKCMTEIARRLNRRAKDVKILNVSDLKKDGADAYDILPNYKTFSDFVAWAKPRAEKFPPQYKPKVIEKVVNETHHHLAIYPDAELPEPPKESALAVWNEIGIAVSETTGNPVYNVNNIFRAIKGHKKLKNKFWYDEFHYKIYTTWNSKKGEVREYDRDVDSIYLLNYMQEDLLLSKAKKEMIHDAIILESYRNKKNDPKDWMETLKWDKKPRLNNFFHEYFGAESTAYTKKAGKNWWITMVARVYDPGCKVDNMVILEGSQGTYKSTALGIIGGRWYAEINEPPTSKDFYMVLHGKLIVEIGELDSFNKAETNTIKKVVSCRTDRFRPPYGGSAKDHPRQCIFIGTTNDDEYLRDPTGARRFWPVKVGSIDLKALERDREQLFAEAIQLYKSKETWYEMPKEAQAEQEKRTEDDAWTHHISEYVHLRSQVTIADVATRGLSMDIDKVNVLTKRRIGAVLKRLGWKSKVISVNGRSSRIYVAGDEHVEKAKEALIKDDIPNYAPGANKQDLIF